jgi:hypothetical protein
VSGATRPLDEVWQSTAGVRKGPDGRYVQSVASDDNVYVRSFEAPVAAPEVSEACRHKRLRGSRRCPGCGRTIGEILIDEG